MSHQHWLVYLSLVVVVIATPGPSAMLCMTHGVSNGKYKTLATVLGGMLASMTLMSFSAMGLGAVIAASDTLFQVIKFAGALYLVVLGVSVWRSTPRGASSVSNEEGGSLTAPSTRQLFRQGFVVGIANPKDLLFFGALFPQFIEPAHALLPQIATLATTWLVVDGAAMTRTRHLRICD